MPKGIPKTAAGGHRDEEYPDDGVLRETTGPRRQRAVAKTKVPAVRRYDFDPEMHNLQYDHPDLYKGGHTPEKKVQAIVCYMITGSASQASKMCGVPAGTILTWRKNSAWWPVLTQQIKKDRDEELDLKITQTLHKAADEIADRLENGETRVNFKTGDQYRVPVTAKDLTGILHKGYMVRALGRGDPTSRVEKLSTEERLRRLSDEFQKFSNARDVTEETEITIFPDQEAS